MTLNKEGLLLYGYCPSLTPPSSHKELLVSYLYGQQRKPTLQLPLPDQLELTSI